MSTQAPAFIRTLVPYVVGFLVTLAARWGVDIEPSAELTGALTVLFGFVYYVAVRLLAKRWPALERLLGVKATPVYKAPEVGS